MNENNRAKPFCIRLADTVIRIESLYHYIQEYCQEYITEEQAVQAQEIFSTNCPGAEVNLLCGGQPVYYYLISAE